MLEEDDALLPAMYATTLSTIEQKPLRQDIAIASNCDTKGHLLPVSKVNKRMYTAPENMEKVIVSTHDYEERLTSSLPIGPLTVQAENVKKMYEVLTR